MYYKAHGSNATWEWLELISPTVDILRKLSRMFNDILGSDQGTKHAPPDLKKDLDAIIDSLDQHQVYVLQPGRVFDDDGHLANNVVEIGHHALSEGARTPLDEYNAAFERLQMRRRMRPVNTELAADDLVQSAPAPKADPDSTHTSPLHVKPAGSAVELDVSDSRMDVDMAEDVEEAVLDHFLEEVEGGRHEMSGAIITEADVEFDMDVVEVAEGDDELSNSDGEVEASEDEGEGEGEEDDGNDE